MSVTAKYQDYGWKHAHASHMHRHFMPHLLELAGPLASRTRVLDVGCGNGYTASLFSERGCEVVGIDLSESGIQYARQSFPGVRFELLAADDRILSNLATEPFDIVVSTEVIEHLYAPRECVRGCFAALKPGGRFICTTPYHGYLKNLAIALTGKFDSHVSPLWDGGHIKLWSRRTLSQLLIETGFQDLQFRGAGRLPFLWMTMVMSGRKPCERNPAQET